MGYQQVDAGNNSSVTQHQQAVTVSAWVKPAIDLASQSGWTGIVDKMYWGSPTSSAFALLQF